MFGALISATDPVTVLSIFQVFQSLLSAFMHNANSCSDLGFGGVEDGKFFESNATGKTKMHETA